MVADPKFPPRLRTGETEHALARLARRRSIPDAPPVLAALRCVSMPMAPAVFAAQFAFRRIRPNPRGFLFGAFPRRVCRPPRMAYCRFLSPAPIQSRQTQAIFFAFRRRRSNQRPQIRNRREPPNSARPWPWKVFYILDFRSPQFRKLFSR